MTALIVFGSTIFLLAAAVGRPYPQSWHRRWSRHT